jgi:drug/metabolite transporter (DMT)-like permease
MKLSTKQAGHLAMLVVAILFSLNINVGKYLLSDYISPFGYTIARTGFAAAAFWLTSVFVRREQVRARDHLLLVFGAVFGIIMNQGLFIFGLERTSPVNASIITTSAPLFAMIIAAIVLQEPVTVKKVSGVLLGILGALLLIITHHQRLGGASVSSGGMGDVAVIGSSFSYALYIVVTKPLSLRYSSVTIMKWMFLYASLGLFPFFYKDLIYSELFKQTDGFPYLMFVYALFFATYLAYMLIPVAQKRIRPTTISMYNNLQPVTATFVAIMLGQDTFSFRKIVAGMLVLAGVYLVTQSKSKKDLDEERKSLPD